MVDIVDAIVQMSECLESDLPDGFTTDLIEYPNNPFDNPNNQKYIRCTWNNLGVVSTDANNCYEITEGVLTIDIFYPKQSGDLQGLRDAGHIKRLFNNYTFDDVEINGATVTPTPEITDWFVSRVEVYYQYEDYLKW